MWFRFDLSISRVGRSIDNGYIEGFWSTLKNEVIKKGYKCNIVNKYFYNNRVSYKI